MQWRHCDDSQQAFLLASDNSDISARKVTPPT
jgi:hypothetical protein